MEIKKNSILRAEITDMNNLGYGVAHVEGMAVFVFGGVTGDVANVKIIKAARDYAVAIISELIKTSPNRITPDCEVFGKCGGCAFRHITREYEAKLKKGFVESAFRKNRVPAEVSEVFTDGNFTGYRNKVQYPVGEDGEIGYYARHSHRLVKSDKCRLADSKIEEISHFTAEYLKKKEVPLRHIYVRTGQKTGQIMVCPVSEVGKMKGEDEFVSALTEKYPEVVSVVFNRQQNGGNVILGDKVRVLYGEDFIEDMLLDCRIRLSSLSFYQVNRGMAEQLYREVHERAVKNSPKRVADLYCGAGTIGITLAKAHPELSITGVEIIPDAVENARYNAMRNGIENAEFILSDAMAAELDGFDCIIVDPPRKGLSRELTDRLCKSGIKHIVYVSCNPETLARDAAMFIEGGFKMNSVRPFDLFPFTGSVEAVTDFER